MCYILQHELAVHVNDLKMEGARQATCGLQLLSQFDHGSYSEDTAATAAAKRSRSFCHKQGSTGWLCTTAAGRNSHQFG